MTRCNRGYFLLFFLVRPSLSKGSIRFVFLETYSFEFSRLHYYLGINFLGFYSYFKVHIALSYRQRATFI